MGEYLQLVARATDRDLDALLDRELGNRPILRHALHTSGGIISTKLATCNDVFLWFDDMVALYWFIHRHQEVFRYGPNHQFNATPDEILSTRNSLYLGPYHSRTTPRATMRIPSDTNEEIQHRLVWRRTRLVQSKHGTWYYRRVRPDETSGVWGNPNGYQTPCPNSTGTFRAGKVGFAWDYRHNVGRDLYRCRRCDVLFNLGEYETPQYSRLAAALRQSSAAVPVLLITS